MMSKYKYYVCKLCMYVRTTNESFLCLFVSSSLSVSLFFPFCYLSPLRFGNSKEIVTEIMRFEIFRIFHLSTLDVLAFVACFSATAACYWSSADLYSFLVHTWFIEIWGSTQREKNNRTKIFRTINIRTYFFQCCIL